MKGELENFIRFLHTEKGFSQGTIEAYQLDLERGLVPFLCYRGKSEPREVTKDDIRAYLDYVARTRGNCNATRARKLAAIKSFFNYLVDNQELEVNPAASIRSPKVPEKEPVYLSDEELSRLLRAIVRKARPQVRERDMAIVILFLHGGLRVSELTRLDLPNVDLEICQIKIIRKGNREQYIHLNQETKTALASYLAKRPHSGNGTFFVGERGGSLTRGYVYGLIRRYLKLAGIDKGKQGPHILRHTFCTRLHQKGVSPFTIKELAGHKSMDTTMKYVKIENREQIEAIDRLQFGQSYPDTRMP